MGAKVLIMYHKRGDGTRHLQMLLTVSSFGESLRWVLPRRRHLKDKIKASYDLVVSGKDDKEGGALAQSRFDPYAAVVVFHD